MKHQITTLSKTCGKGGTIKPKFGTNKNVSSSSLISLGQIVHSSLQIKFYRHDGTGEGRGEHNTDPRSERGDH